ncbi:SUKH-4 family immunity protein [Streptomyces sp. NBC_00878]|uniref:SUKH-4 family immunity protein n=1 Tax=Streptomyces sp. NBC_00878 TaxID=2975854 RepID=UPI0022507B00|nr:SUKH-4 family immunity protein [Streptomyces sp. NBC_00878]MCX4908320.1 SUKH-4 family immunity protein [Streptomyces sp. NBC_00878]
MSTSTSTTTSTDTGTKTITLTEDELDPYVTHAATRSWLASPGLPGPGLPGDGGLLTFEALRAGGPRTVADSMGDPDLLAADLRDQLVIGALRGPADAETESILLDGATGEVSTTYVLQDRPDLMDRRPLAPSLQVLTDFVAATEEMAARRGRFASYEGRFGPKAVAGMSRQLLAVFEEGTGGEVPPFWRMAALIRPLALVAGPPADAALTLDLPTRLLDEEFGQGRVARFEDVDFPAALAHEPTRRFLRETGLPEDGFLFQLDTDVPLPTLAEYYEDERPGEYTADELPDDADHLIRLGHLIEDNSLVVDGATGAILNWSEPEATLYALNTDISTLAFTLWLLHREKTIDETLSHELTADAYDQLATTMTQTLSTVDPTGSAPQSTWHYWTELFQDEAGGVL